jgi:integrase
MPWYKDERTGTYFFKINYKDADGRYKQVMRRGFKTQAEVKRAMAAMEAEINAGTYIQPKKITLAEYLGEWLDGKKISVKRRTYENYVRLIRLHVLPALGKMELQKVEPRHIQKLYNDISESGALSDENIQKIHTLLKDAFKQAKAWKMIADNPAEYVKRPAARKKEMQVWTLEEAQRFLEVAKDDPLHIVFLLALTTGMRQGEILGLRWKDIDRERGIISVSQILNHDGKEFEAGAKSLSGVRPIRVDRNTLDYIEAHRKKQLERRMKYADMFEDRDLVVCTRFGGPLSPRNVNRTFKRLIEKADVPDIRFHDLRHTHVTFLIKNRETPQAIAERLGWSDTRMIDKYAHIRPDIQADVAEAFGAAFYGSRDTKNDTNSPRDTKFDTRKGDETVQNGNDENAANT